MNTPHIGEVDQNDDEVDVYIFEDESDQLGLVTISVGIDEGVPYVYISGRGASNTRVTKAGV